ncbi:ASKHA domain-containing protein [Desulfosarcina sp.]|uniref:ASKHA domain-containing protein n=1 Tax=Desulfosarcina sp. TaxID=2027861 RepID=UPI0039706C41
MTQSNAEKDTITLMMERLLSGPARPGQTFSMPGCDYDGLYRMARRIKASFDSRKVDGAPVCLCTEDRTLMAAALLASLAGGPELLLPHTLSATALMDLHQLTGFNRAVAKPGHLLPVGVSAIDVLALADEAETLRSEEEPDPDRTWIHLFTGGSTGAPRLWSKTPRNLLGEVDYLLTRYEIQSSDRILASVPALHIYGLLYSLLAPLAASARVVASTPSFPEEIKQQMVDAAPTIFVSVPVHYRALRESPADKRALRLAFSSAGPLAEADGAAFGSSAGVDLIEIYGSTETGGIATRCRAKGEAHFTPYSCIQWRVAGDMLDIRSPFLSRELPVHGNGWFTVADRVKAHGSQGFVVTGRADNIVKVGGNRVDLEKVRQVIMDIAGVDEALVIANSVETGRDREIIALVAGSACDDDVRACLDKALEPHEKPRQIRIVDRIPRAATGKIDRRAIEKIAAAQAITFEPAGLKVPLDENKTLQEMGTDCGIGIRADCGGVGICGKCRVLVHPQQNFSLPTDEELDSLTPDQMAGGSRLACQARAIGRGTVTIPDNLEESSETRGKTGIARSYPVDAMTRRLAFTGRPPGLKTDNSPESLLDWLAAQVGDPAAAVADIASLRQLGGYRDSLKTFTLVVHEEIGLRRILAGSQSAGLGFAVDLGTTSLAGYLCDLRSGALLAADACVNPQRRFGEDVISRISRINAKDAHLDQLQRLAVEGINLLMHRCLAHIGATCGDVDEVGVCGNTTMQQIFAGLHPYGLGVFPYLPLTLTPPTLNAKDLGLTTDAAVPVFFMPVVSGFVGGDTMAAILADRPHERSAVTLIIDIGTNGEVVLGNRDGLWVTSCATGPALEGAQISCGMRAVSGAIHRAWPDESNRRVVYEVLGNDGRNRPMGMCGSGIIDTIAALRQIGAILPNGRLDETISGVVADQRGIGRHYTIAGRDQSATSRDISVTLNDVRQIQLAKAALSTGIEFLMRKAGIDKIERTILTGAFGARFNWKNALAIGMLPPAVADGLVMPKDNLAGVGVVMALLDKKLRAEARDLCRRIRYLELASEPDFATAFSRATAFPEVTPSAESTTLEG